MHIEPIDPRSRHSAPVVLVYPYGIVVDQDGHRFFDEGDGLVHETWEAFARDIHFARPNSIAYAILDSRLFDITGFERAIRSDVPPHRAGTIEELSMLIGVPPGNLKAAVDAYNAAATGNPATFDATRCDGLAADRSLQPPKSNWARAISSRPFRLSAGRRHCLHLWRPCHRHQSRGAGRARAHAWSLCGGRDHRAFLRHRTERGAVLRALVLEGSRAERRSISCKDGP